MAENNSKVNLTPDLEKFKYEVAQEIGILTRKNKKYPSSTEKYPEFESKG